MRVEPFAVEEWMARYEHEVRYNLAETCVKPFQVRELLELTGQVDQHLQNILDMQLHYGDIPGSPRLRQGLARLYRDLDPERILVTHGAIGANFLVFYTLVEPGDTVVSIFPAYEQLYRAAESLGATVRRWELRPENGYQPDLAELERLLDDRTRLVVINNPHNPTGALIEEPLLREIARRAEEVGAYLLCDEAYRGLWLDDTVTAPSAVEVSPRAIVTGSFAKPFSLAGLRLGWIAGPPEVVRACWQHRDYTTISVGRIDDYLAAVAMEHVEKVMARNLALLRRNFRIVERWVATEPHITWVRPRAGTTAFLQYDLDIPSMALCEGLIREESTFLVPGACFEREGFLRLGYAGDTSILQEGLRRISRYLASLSRSHSPGRGGSHAADSREGGGTLYTS